MTHSSVVLLEVYKAAMEEDRFQVRLNWDRTKFFIVLNVTLLAAAAGVIQLAAAPIFAAAALLVLVAGVTVSRLGIRAIDQGKTYHRAALARRVQLEEALGIAGPAGGREGEHATFAVSPVPRSKAREILDNVDAYVSPGVRPKSITGQTVDILWLLGTVHFGGAILVTLALIGCWVGPATCIP